MVSVLVSALCLRLFSLFQSLYLLRCRQKWKLETFPAAIRTVITHDAVRVLQSVTLSGFKDVPAVTDEASLHVLEKHQAVS